jgi:hypothetical protein
MRRSVIGTNIALAMLVGALCWLLGWRDFLLVQAPTVMLAGSAGIWLFYVQHQFEDAYWQDTEGWSYADAALRGQLLPEAAEGPAVLLGQHRPAPRPPPERPHPQLQPAAGARRERDLPGRADTLVQRRPAHRPTEALGRGPWTPRHFRAGATAGRGERPLKPEFSGTHRSVGARLPG